MSELQLRFAQLEKEKAEVELRLLELKMEKLSLEKEVEENRRKLLFGYIVPNVVLPKSAICYSRSATRKKIETLGDLICEFQIEENQYVYQLSKGSVVHWDQTCFQLKNKKPVKVQIKDHLHSKICKNCCNF